jgi:hypothetical protein
MDADHTRTTLPTLRRRTGRMSAFTVHNLPLPTLALLPTRALTHAEGPTNVFWWA